MRRLILMMCSVFLLFGGAAGCDRDHSEMVSNTGNSNNESSNTNRTKDNETKGSKMKIKIGARTFNATLFDNETAKNKVQAHQDERNSPYTEKG